MMPTVRLYDPYRLIDPTNRSDVTVHVPSRTSSGKFNGTAIEYGHDAYPIESKYWARYARGAYARLGRALSAENYLEISKVLVPGEVADRFSWRMLCEFYEAAANQAEKTPDDLPAILAAAYKYLADKQYEIARALLKQKFGDLVPLNPPAAQLSRVLSDWLGENWDLIPEVSY